MEYQTYAVSRRDKEPLVNFMLRSLRDAGCRILNYSDFGQAPFRFTFEAPDGERMGVVAYAFNANQRDTKNRPKDEHRFQVKYGSEKDNAHVLHELWHDPYELYTTLLIGINTDRNFFVGVDPVLHQQTRFFISIEYKEHHVQALEASGWHHWQRQKRDRSGRDEPAEVLVGGKPEHFLDYVRFERSAKGLSQGHRDLLAEKLGRLHQVSTAGIATAAPTVANAHVHTLAAEFELTTTEILDLIQNAPRLKMAVRGWVAEQHLVEELRSLDFQCEALEGEGQPDVLVRLPDKPPVLIECKNVLRQTYADGTFKLDFQKTRASKDDPCSRYYLPSDFQVAAACLHPQTESWEFRYALTRALDGHDKCPGRITNRIRLDDRWRFDAIEVIHDAVPSNH